MEINAFLPSPDRKNTFYKQRGTADGVMGAIMAVLSIERDSVALCDLPFSCVLENCVYIEKNKRYNLMQCLDYSLAAWFFHWIDKPIEGLMERKLDGARTRFRTIRIGRGGLVGAVNFSGAE